MKSKKQNKNQKLNGIVGWECPKCGSVYSPYIRECDTCKNSNMRVTTSGTTDFILRTPVRSINGR